MNNSKKKLMAEIEAEFYIEQTLNYYGLSKDYIVGKYQEKRRNKDICSYALEHLEDSIKKRHDFLGRINFLYNNKNNDGVIGEIIYYTSRKEYKAEIYESYDCGRPISCKVIKNKEKDLSVQRERSWFE